MTNKSFLRYLLVLGTLSWWTAVAFLFIAAAPAWIKILGVVFTLLITRRTIIEFFDWEYVFSHEKDVHFIGRCHIKWVDRTGKKVNTGETNSHGQDIIIDLKNSARKNMYLGRWTVFYPASDEKRTFYRDNLDLFDETWYLIG